MRLKQRAKQILARAEAKGEASYSFLEETKEPLRLGSPNSSWVLAFLTQKPTFAF